MSLLLGLLIGAAAADRPLPFDPPVVTWYEITAKGAPRAFRSLQGFADCIAKKAPEQTSKFLAMNYPGKDADTEARKLATDNEACADTYFLTFTTEYMRGALIEAAYHALQGGATPPAKISLGASGMGDMGQPPTIAGCVVGRQPQLSAELLSTRIASPDQERVFHTLQPDVDQCARAAGVKKVQPELLRYQIAEALYRRLPDRQPVNEAAK